MRRPLGAIGACLALLAWSACDAPELLGHLGLRTIREVPAERAARFAERGDGVFVQLRDASDRLPHLPGTQLLGRDEEVPEGLRNRDGWVLVISSDAEERLRLAARLSRAGLRHVAVVTGDVAVLRDLGTAARQDGPPLQPWGLDRHPTTPERTARAGPARRE